MVKIHIGDEWVIVPFDYGKDEAEYCKEEQKAFYDCPEKHPDKDALRQKVLDKRVEYYRQYKAKQEG